MIDFEACKLPQMSVTNGHGCSVFHYFKRKPEHKLLKKKEKKNCLIVAFEEMLCLGRC